MAGPHTPSAAIPEPPGPEAAAPSVPSTSPDPSGLEPGPGLERSAEPPEDLESMEPAPDLSESPKGPVRQALSRARESVIGSTHLGQEIRRAGVALASAPIGFYAGTLRGMRKLLSRTPMEGVRELAGAVGNTLSNAAQVITAPGRMVVAAGAGVGRGVKKAGTLGAKAVAGAALLPLHLFNVSRAGAERLEQKLEALKPQLEPTPEPAPA